MEGMVQPEFMHDVRGYGALGDGQTINTAAIQGALDACSRAGGGVVVVPPGVFLSGTLYLRDRIHLYLAPGAVLKASARREDYNADDAFPQNRVIHKEHVSGAHFLLGIGVRDVTISGEGAIDGHSEVFRGPLQERPGEEPVCGFAEWRPAQMIYFCESRNLRLEGITVRQAPYWHIFIHGCADIRIHGLRIFADRSTRNGDGIDLDCCVRAVVSDCLIDSSDDCLTVRASGATLLHTPALSEQIAVTNCVLRSRTCGVRVGVGSGTIRNVVFSNLVIRDVKSGIHLQGKWSRECKGVEIDTIRFANVSIHGRVAFHGTMGVAPCKPIRNIFFSDINAQCDSASYLGGSPEQPVRDVTFDNVHLTLRGGRDNDPRLHSLYEIYRDAPGYGQRAFGFPFGVLLEHAEGIRVRGMTVRWRDTEGPWLEAIHGRALADTSFEDVDAEVPPGGKAALGLESSQAITLRNCRSRPPAQPFLHTDAATRDEVDEG